MSNSNSVDSFDEISIVRVAKLLYDKKLRFVIVALIVACLSSIYIYNVPNQYKAKALLIPVVGDNNSTIDGFANKLGGLASLAGINLSGGGNNMIGTAIAIANSKKFLFEIIENERLAVPLIAANGYDMRTGELLIDQSLYDENTNKWVRKDTPVVPTTFEVYEELEKIITFQLNEETGFVRVEVEFYSPEFSLNLASAIIDNINRVMKLRDKEEAQKNIEYLKSQLKNATILENKQLLFQLIAEQEKKLMLAEVKDEYAFSIIDPPFVSEHKSKPNRTLFVIMSVFLTLSMILIFYILKIILNYNKLISN